jgi:HSP20 family protein
MTTIKKHRHPLLSDHFVPQGFQELVDSFFSDNNLATHEGDIHFRPSAEILENDNEFVIRLGLQAVEKEDIAIEVKNHLLTISGKRVDKNDKKAIKMSEFTYGNFKRSFQLNEEIQEENIKAHFENGILSIQIPKKEVKKPFQIEIG